MGKINFTRGLFARLKQLTLGEPAVTSDTHQVFIGTNDGNVEVHTDKWAERQVFFNGTYTIPGETTQLYRVQSRNVEPFTVVEVASPPSSDGGDSEATLTLMREVDGETGGAEFLDLYNNGYSDSRQMGVRVQTRGGTLRDFVFDFFNGATRREAMRVTTDRVKVMDILQLMGSGDKYVEFMNASGTRVGYFGRINNNMFRWINTVVGSSVELLDSGSMVFYTPSSDVYFYIDAGWMYVNDLRVQVERKGTTAQRPTGASRYTGVQYYDTTLLKPIWWNGTNWKDAVGTTV